MTQPSVNLTSAVSRCRSAVDEIDNEIAALLNKRFEICRELAMIEKKLDMPIMDPQRELSIFERVSALSLESRDAANVLAVFRQILQESRAVQLKTGGTAT